MIGLRLRDSRGEKVNWLVLGGIFGCLGGAFVVARGVGAVGSAGSVVTMLLLVYDDVNCVL